MDTKYGRTEYTSKSNHREVLEKIKGRFDNYDADITNVKDRLQQLISQGMSAPMYFDVDEAGDIYVYYDDGFGPPNVEYDTETGDFYWIFYLQD